MTPTRRDFLKFTASGIAVTLLPVQAARAALFEDRLVELPVVPQGDMRLKRRIDGVAKVTGSKVFARDIRARDMQGWPFEQAHAFMVLSPRADAPYLDISVRGLTLLPDRDFARFSVAKRLYKARRDDVIGFGQGHSQLRLHKRRSGEQRPRDRFNAIKDGNVFPPYEGNEVILPGADSFGDVMEGAMSFAEEKIAAIRAPIGLFGPTRDARSLAVSILAEIISLRSAPVSR